MEIVVLDTIKMTDIALKYQVLVILIFIMSLEFHLYYNMYYLDLETNTIYYCNLYKTTAISILVLR